MAKNKTLPETDMATELLLKEADEALRQEKMEAMWKEWGQTIVGVALMVIFGTMLGVGWKNWRNSVHESSTQALIMTQAESSPMAIEEANDLSGAHKGIADLLTASALVTNDMDVDTQNSILMMMQDAEDTGLPAKWDVIATWTKLRIEANTAQTADKKIAAADGMIKAAESDNNPYAPLMLAEAAGLYGENGNPQRALEVLAQAKDMPTAAKTPAMANLITKLTHLYTTDLSLIDGE